MPVALRFNVSSLTSSVHQPLPFQYSQESSGLAVVSPSSRCQSPKEVSITNSADAWAGSGRIEQHQLRVIAAAQRKRSALLYFSGVNLWELNRKSRQQVGVPVATARRRKLHES